MCVRAADERQRAVLLSGDAEKIGHEGVVLVGHRAVLHLEDVEERQHRGEEVLGRLPSAIGLEEVVRRKKEVLGSQVLDEVEDVAPLPGDDLVLGRASDRRR